MSLVSLIKSSQHYQGTLKVLSPLKEDLVKKISGLDKIVIKINFVTTEIELATSPFQSVKGFIDFIKPFFKGKIIIAEEASFGKTEAGFKRFGFSDLADNDPQVEVYNSALGGSKKVKLSYSGGEISLNQLRGSHSIAHLSDAVIALERNQQAEDDSEANLTQFRVLKNRYAGFVGPAGWVHYDRKTGRLTEVLDKEEFVAEHAAEGKNF